MSAFNSFIAVYTEKQPSAAADLLKYVEVVQDIASKGGNWRYYDEQFRYLRQSSPTDAPWGQVHWELWFNSLHNFHGLSGKQSSQPKAARKSQQYFPKGTCWAFHAGKPCQGCSFEHVCYKCGKAHPASQCRSSNANTSQARFTGQGAKLPFLKPPGLPSKPSGNSSQIGEASNLSRRV